ncbi:MAG: ABC transporter ATP-binding protein [Candidatus Kapabacteria bacterium]|nr:ABC transporter ATP-binding protein [Candidatus Kapabacteria bacterium]
MELVISNLSKTYPNGVRALDNISLTIPQGMFGLLGPNGAGKSSLMRTIATLQEPDSGTIMFDNTNVLTQKEDVRRFLGYLPQEFGLYPNLSADTILDHFAVLKGITNSSERKAQVEYLLQRTNLWQNRKKSVGGFSGGMKQRLGIAIALLGSPKLIIVDEPTAGLDPTERHRFLNLLSELGENIVIILSTHIVEDVRELCSSMAIINKGKVALSGEPGSVIENVKGKIWKRFVDKNEMDSIAKEYNVISTRMIAGRPLVHVYSDEQLANGFIQIEPDLEDVYFHQISLLQQAPQESETTTVGE